jgi:nucleoside-diphosphate kinase
MPICKTLDTNKEREQMLERTLVLLKPSTVERALIGEIINRFEKKGLRIAGMKMMQLDDDILAEHYSHLTSKPFFGILKASMMKTPVVAMCLEGVDAIAVVRYITGYTNGRKADPGTIRGDYCMSNQQNIVHASDSPEAAEAELKRFFRPEEIFDLKDMNLSRLYAADEI